MKDKYLQTIVEGCAWCKSVINIFNHEAEKSEELELLLLTHGTCTECRDNMLEEVLD